MCGICGALGPSDPEEITRRMLPHLAHRGPDSEGVWSGSGVSLGHRRLSIVDLSAAGQQPMQTADGKLVLIANGEIYNYPALRKTLETQGEVFRSSSDSEVLLHAYQAHGTQAFAMLNGMFACALYDVEQQRLILARDRLGIKPIYYAHDAASNTLLFASEIKAILAAAGRTHWTIDPQGLHQYLTHENMMGEASLFKGIRLLSPGTLLIADAAGIRTEQFWTADVSGDFPTTEFASATTAFGQSFAASVGRHLMSDVPLASYLSSGFDSTMVACKAAALNGAPLAAFTGTFAELGWYDEATGARLVADKIGASFTPVTISADDFMAEFDNVIYALDEPRMGTGAFSQYMVAKTAARNNKVILTGHGGDELFSGYPIFKLAMLVDATSLRQWLGCLTSVRLSELPHLVYFLLRRMVSRGAQSNLPVLFSAAQLAKGLSAGAQRAVAAQRSATAVPTATTKKQDYAMYRQILRDYLTIYLPGLLVVEDKISMAHSLESRTPFLDNAMVDLALSINPAAKLDQGELKAIIKAAARGLLPDEIFSFPKRGFPTPVAAWLRGPCRGWMEERLLAPDSALHTLFTPEFLQGEVKRYLTSWRRKVRPLDEIQTHRMWMLLSLESWLRQTHARLGVTLEV